MRFKIQGEKEEIDETRLTTVVEILGKKAIENLIDKKIAETFGDLERQIKELRDRVYSLEEQIAIKRKELLKLEEKK